MAEQKKEETKEEFISLKGGRSREEVKKEPASHEHKAHFTTTPASEKEYVLDFSKFSGIFEKIDKRIVIYSILAIILLISAYLRYMPVNSYPKEAPLGVADNWWQYRHAKEIYEHGYPGTTVVTASPQKMCISSLFCFLSKGVYWDYLHDAPEGGAAPIELYHYFVAYSYKYFFRLFFPSLIKYLQFVPVMFGVLSGLAIFLLTREGFGEKAGLGAALLFSLAPHLLQRSLVGQADTDIFITFFTIFTAFLFFRAWNKKSFKWAAIAGVSLGLFAFSWPAGYVSVPLIILAAAFVHYTYVLLRKALLEKGPFFEFKNYYISFILAVLFSLFVVFIQGLSKTLLFTLAGLLFTVLLPIPLLTMFLKNRDLLKNLVKEEWRGLAIIAIFLIVGFSIISIIFGPAYINLFDAAARLTQLRAASRTLNPGSTDVIRNVFLTVAEFNPANMRTIIFSIHASIFILAFSSLLLLPLGLLKKIKSNIFFFSMILIWAMATFYSAFQGNRFIESFSIPMAILASIIVGASNYYDVSDKNTLKKILTFGPLLLLFIVILFIPNISTVKGESQFGLPYVQYSFAIAKSGGGGEGQNWLDFYKWAKENTPPGTIFASWWDPGHAFTALAERPCVADGSQNHRHVHDLAVIFTTTNTTRAVDLIKKYNISYFYTSTDLIYKYGAISFLASGNGENYQTLSADKSQMTPPVNGNILIPYPFNVQTNQGIAKTMIFLSIKNNGSEVSASWAIGDNPPQKIKHLFLPGQNGAGVFKEEPGNDTIDMLLYVLPGYGNAMFLPSHLEENTLSRLHLFDGNTVSQYFEKVKDFGGEIKVYKVKYPQ